MTYPPLAKHSFFDGHIRVYGPHFKDHQVIPSRVEINVPGYFMTTSAVSKYGLAILNAAECARSLDIAAGVHTA